MTYEQIVDMVRTCYENAGDARDIFEHIAVQINITGEGHGAFYIEIADRQICVEPYEYYDRDAIVTTSAEYLSRIMKQELTFFDAIQTGKMNVFGDASKVNQLDKIRIKKKS